MNIDDIYINDPNIWLTTDNYGDTIMPEQAKDQLYKAVMEVIGEDFIVATQYDEAINGVLKMQRQRANKFFGRDK